MISSANSNVRQSDNLRMRSSNPATNTNSSRKKRNEDPNTETEFVEDTPLINNASKPPIANPEIDDSDDGRELINTPQPGVDDGFFDNTAPKNENPDIEVFSTNKPNDIPTIVPRSESDDDENNKKPNHPNEKKPDDVGRNPENPDYPERPTLGFPYYPGYGPDIEFGGTIPDLESIPDVNVYQHKKTLAQGMMDLALISANANQLRYVLESYKRHPYFYPSFVFITISLILQIAVGIGLIWNATYNVKDKKEICIANKINNFTIIGIFLVTIVNVFISAFGVANPPA